MSKIFKDVKHSLAFIYKYIRGAYLGIVINRGTVTYPTVS